MSNKTELPKEWQQEAEKEAAYEYNDEVGYYACKSGYVNGAKAMLEAVEKAFKDEVASLTREQERTDSLQYKSDLNQQKEVIMLLHFKLQYLTPTQDGK